MRRKRGEFIVLEGTEGCGKSTHSLRLADYIRKSRGRNVLRVREPGGTVLGEKIREVLLDRKSRMAPEAETLLYMTARAQLAKEVILPALKSGKVVISDRWLHATVAYQGYGAGVPVGWIRQIARGALGSLKPGLSILLDVPLRQGLERARKRGAPDRIESRSVGYHARVRRGYLRQVKSCRSFKRVPVGTISQTEERIRRLVDDFLG